MAVNREEEAWRVGATNRQREYFMLFGSRPYDEIENTNLFCLKRKVGYGVFGLPSESPNLSNYYTGYNNEQREHIEKIYEKIIEKSDFDEIRFACTILVVHNGSENGETTVFRIGTQQGDIFIDNHARVYSNWEHYMNNNKLPDCEYCFPVNGNYNTGGIGFSYSPASSTFSKVISCADTAGTVISVVGASIFAASCAVTVTPAVLSAAGASAACTGIYCTTRSIQTLIDRKNHDQSIGLNESESRFAWINVASSALSAGTTAALGKAQSIAKSGKSLSNVARYGIHALTATAVAFSGYGFVDTLYNCVDKYQKGALTKKDVFDLSCELLFLFNALHSAKATTELVHNMSAVSETVSIKKKLTKTQKRNLRRRAAKRRAKGLSSVVSEEPNNDNNSFMILLPMLYKCVVHFEPRIQTIIYSFYKIGHELQRWKTGEISIIQLINSIGPCIVELTDIFTDEIGEVIRQIESFFNFSNVTNHEMFQENQEMVNENQEVFNENPTLNDNHKMFHDNHEVVNENPILNDNHEMFNENQERFLENLEFYMWFESSSKKLKLFFINIVLNMKNEIEAAIREAEKDINDLNDYFENTDDTINSNSEESDNNVNDTTGDFTDNPENNESVANDDNIEGIESVGDDSLNPEVQCLLAKSTEFITRGICNDLEEYSYAVDELKRSVVSEFKNQVNRYKELIEAVKYALTSDIATFNEVDSVEIHDYLIKTIKSLNTNCEFRVKLDRFIKLLEDALSVSEDLDVDQFIRVLKVTNDANQENIIKCLGINKTFRENVKSYITYLEAGLSVSTFDIGAFNEVLGITGDVTQHFYNETIKSLNTDSCIDRIHEKYRQSKRERANRSTFPIWNVVTEGTFFYCGPHGANTLSKESLLCIVSQALNLVLGENNSKWSELNDIILIEVNNESSENSQSNVKSDRKVLMVIVTQEVDEENTASGLILVFK